MFIISQEDIDERLQTVATRLLDYYGIQVSNFIPEKDIEFIKDSKLISTKVLAYKAASNHGKLRITFSRNFTNIAIPSLIKYDGKSFTSTTTNENLKNIISDFVSKADVLKAVTLIKNDFAFNFLKGIKVITKCVIKTRKNSTPLLKINLINRCGYANLYVATTVLYQSYHYSYSVTYSGQRVYSNDLNYLKEQVHSLNHIAINKKADYESLGTLTQMIFY